MALPRENRLTKKRDFDIVFKEGKTVKGSFLFIKSKDNKLNIPRLGFIITKKVLSKASARNRLKRALSKTVRIFIKENKEAGIDRVIVVKKTGEEASLIKELANLLHVSGN